ncbi:unnamed protein product [Mesocestoides corti]|uniref:5-formyltetrahydrofolate cyclo-ligase n=2 Tax=Mesocestoides corti TaxID=53468 RepID=A0A0R3UGB9_MESCO|nr:unnamed protein product [Mesocestoides corti]
MVAKNKQELRQYMKSILSNIPPSIRKRKSQVLLQKVLAHEFFKTCKGVSIFVSFSYEPDTIALIRHALEAGKVVVVPKILADSERCNSLTKRFGLMRMRQLHSLDELFTWPLNKFGIREPPQPTTGIDKDDALTLPVDLFILPGLAFSAAGDRLGRGKGFYDHYLTGMREYHSENNPSVPLPRTIALAFSEQILENLFVEGHDAKVDTVLIA